MGENDTNFTLLNCDSKIPQDFQNLINSTKCSSEFKSFYFMIFINSLLMKYFAELTYRENSQTFWNRLQYALPYKRLKKSRNSGTLRSEFTVPLRSQ